MALFDRSGLSGRFGRKKRARKSWWEMTEEFSPPGALYEPEEDFDPMERVFDPLGSYTGVPEGGGEPEQDADDL